MRRRLFAGRISDVDAGADLLLNGVELALEQINLLPLRRDGRVQFIDGLVLIGNAGFQRVQAVGEIGHQVTPGWTNGPLPVWAPALVSGAEGGKASRCASPLPIQLLMLLRKRVARHEGRWN